MNDFCAGLARFGLARPVLTRPGLARAVLARPALLAGALALSSAAWPLSSDRDQDLVVNSDRAELDTANNIAVYRGAVVVTQGSLRMTGETLTVHFDEQGEATLVIMLGDPATYEQLPDEASVPDQASARRMEYQVLNHRVILIDQAWVQQDNMRFSGQRIVYNTLSSKAFMEGAERGSGEPSRVRTVIGDEAPAQ